MNHHQDFHQLCQQIRPHIKEVDCTQTVKMLAQQDVILIDVRDRHEYEAGSIPESFHLSKGWIEAKIHQLVSDKSRPIILYCGGGNRSLIAAYNLKQMGYQQVYSMAGGYKAWLLVNQVS